MIDPGALLARLQAGLWSAARAAPSSTASSPASTMAPSTASPASSSTVLAAVPSNLTGGTGGGDLGAGPSTLTHGGAPAAAAAPEAGVVVALSPAALGATSGPPLDAAGAKTLSAELSQPPLAAAAVPADAAPSTAAAPRPGWFAGLRLPPLPSLSPPDAPAPLADEAHLRQIWAAQARAGLSRTPERALRPLLVALGAAGLAAATDARGGDAEAVAKLVLRAVRAVELGAQELPPERVEDRAALVAALELRAPVDPRPLRLALLRALGRMGAPDAALVDPYALELAVQAARARVVALRRRLLWSALLTVLLPGLIVLLAQALSPER